MIQLKGFRKGSKLHDLYLKQNIKNVVSREAMGFLLAGFLGGLCGGIVGSIFAFGLGALLF